jgi:hypothetical protein
LVRVSPRVLLCCKTPLHGIEDDARMLEMQGGVLKIKDEASMVIFGASCFSKKERVWEEGGGRFWGVGRLGLGLQNFIFLYGRLGLGLGAKILA